MKPPQCATDDRLEARSHTASVTEEPCASGSRELVLGVEDVIQKSLPLVFGENESARSLTLSRRSGGALVAKDSA